MKKTFSILALVVTFFLVSCKKENTDQPGVDPGTTVSKKLIISDMGGAFFRFTYNPDGSIATFFRKYPNDSNTIYFTYTPGKVNYKIMTHTNLEAEVGEITLVNGKAKTFVWTYFDAFHNPIGTYHELFEYNAKGLMEKHFIDNVLRAKLIYNSNDDVTEWQGYNLQGVLSSKTEYTYTNKRDLFPSFNYFDNWFTGFFLPAKSRHLPATYKTTNLLNNTVTYEGNFAYEFDSDAYVKKWITNTTFPNVGQYTALNSYQ